MTIEELRQIAETERAAQAKYQHHVCVCIAAGCVSSGSRRGPRGAERKEVAESGMQNEVLVKGIGCMGLCSAGPLVSVESDGKMYANVTPAEAPDIIRHLDTGSNGLPANSPPNIPFFERQKKIVLENSGHIDPERIEDYIAADGYHALVTAITEMTPAEVIAEVVRSGLRGRGGAGYPTGLKWATVAKAGERAEVRHLQRRRGRPRRLHGPRVLESDPHRVLEGMAIAAYAVGASQGYIYVRAEYPLAIKRLKTAIQQAERLGLLGSDIFGTRFNFHVDIRIGAGAFVCGEETALIASIEGKRGTPRPRPPYPGRVRPVGLPDPHQQRRDLRQRPADHPQRRRLVRRHRHREEQGHQGLRPGRQDQQHRPDRGADGHHAARDRRGDRRRRPRRQGVQGRADRRPLRRLHPRRAPRHAGRLRVAAAASARSWAPAA